MIDGIVSVIKPAGMSSSEAVSVFRHASGERKVGHLGTLDPAAAGVMVMLLGRATKLFDRISEGEKEYIAIFTFGVETDTLDQEGSVIKRMDWNGTEEQIRAAIPRFLGEITQIPPMFSAVTMGGERLYHMARRGAEVEIPSRQVTIREMELLSYHGSEAKFRIVCSKGTYIRSLCRDLAEALGSCGFVSYLLRTRSGDYTLDQSMTLFEAASLGAKGELVPHLRSMESALHFLPAYTIPPKRWVYFSNGIPLNRGNFPDSEYCRLYANAQFVGIGRVVETQKGKRLKFDLHLEDEHADTGSPE